MKNKKTLIALLLVGILSAIGATFAYYSSSNTFENIFNTDTYSTEVTEVFDSPQDWTPGTTTEKQIYATNKGNVDAAVRVSYEEKWEDASGNELPPEDNEYPPNRYAIINHPSNFDGKWIESTEGGTTYYYYKYKIGTDERTTNFMDSVTYNANTVTQATDGCVENAETHTKICSSTLNGYGGGTYTLTIKIETAQYDQYKNIWNTEVNILDGLPYTIVSGDLDTIGSVVKIANEEFYVIGQEDATHVKLITKWNLKVGNVYRMVNMYGEHELNSTYTSADEGYGLQSSEMTSNTIQYKRGVVPFASSTYWHDTSTNRLKEKYGGYSTTTSGGKTYYVNTLGIAMTPYIYTNEKENDTYLASIAEYVENYVEYLNEQGASTTGRLLSLHEVEELFNDGNKLSTPSGSLSSYDTEGKEWMFNSSYWIGSIDSRTTDCVTRIDNGSNYNCNDPTFELYYGVRPVIILTK